MAIVCFILGGFFVGGVYALVKAGASKIAIGVVGLLALAALVGGVLWLLPSGS